MQSATVRKFRTVRKEGNRMVTRNMDYYNLDSKQSLRAVLRTLIKIYTFAPNFKFGTK